MVSLVESIKSSVGIGVAAKNNEFLNDFKKLFSWNSHTKEIKDFFKKNHFMPKVDFIKIAENVEKDYLKKLYKLKSYHTVTWRGKKDTDKPTEILSHILSYQLDKNESNDNSAYAYGVHIGYNQFSSGVEYIHGTFYILGVSETAFYVVDGVPELKSFYKKLDEDFENKYTITESEYAKSEPFENYRKYEFKNYTKLLK